jgi:hypothetical protein
MKITTLLSIVLGLALTGSAWAQSPSAAPAAVQPTVVYVPQIPSPTQLISAAGAQHLSVQKITQSAGQISAVYQMTNGQTYTVTYLPLPENEAAAISAPTAAPATVVYTTAPAPAYYPYGYAPWGWYPPIAIGFGFGFHGRWR